MSTSKRVNKSPLSAREGTIYLDGVKVADACKFQIIFKPSVWEGKTLSEKGTNRRWTGYDIEVLLEQWKTTNQYSKAIANYIKTGATPEFKIQGIQEDKNSDYYDSNKALKVTVVGCVPKEDINLMDLDTDGDVVKDSVKFGAKDIA
jgi:hypothetical protein